MSLRFDSLVGPEITGALDAVARLRIEVFREWPYLYDGDPAYEASYLSAFAASPQAIVVAASDGGEIVGASTGAPLSDHAEDFAEAFRGSGIALEEVFYCAESVLRAPYRGQGAGHVFFDRREDHARRLGFRFAAFCAVVRPDDHPARPAEYRPLDDFWRHRGYERAQGVMAQFSWKDIGKMQPDAKPLQFWIRDLSWGTAPGTVRGTG